jgi:hypothetical protein
VPTVSNLKSGRCHLRHGEQVQGDGVHLKMAPLVITHDLLEKEQRPVEDELFIGNNILQKRQM